MNKIGFTACLIGFLAICGVMTSQYVTRVNARNAMENIVAEVNAAPGTMKSAATVSTSAKSDKKTATPAPTVTPIPTPTTDPLAARNIVIPEKNLNWDELKKQNADIYAWIYIPGTIIDYPILQHADEKSYYLNHNIDGSEGYPGCIYTQNVNSKDWKDPNTVIYGHNMNNGSMFHDLHKFADGAFFNETQYVYVYTPERNYVYEIFAAYTFSNVDLMMCFDYSTPEACLVYFDGIWTNRDMRSHFREGVTLTGSSRIITMSTCVANQPEYRYLVQAVLLNPAE